MKLVEHAAETLPDGTLHETSRFDCGCVEDTYESPSGSVSSGQLEHYCQQHGGGATYELADLQPYLDAIRNSVARLGLAAGAPARLFVDQHDVVEIEP